MNITNWRTTIFGCITVLALVISSNPHSIDFLGDAKIIQMVAGFAGLITGCIAFSNAKDKQVVGNGTMQEPNKVAQSNGTNKVVIPVIIALAIPFFFCSCAGFKVTPLPKGSYAYGEADYSKDDGVTGDVGVRIPLDGGGK